MNELKMQKNMDLKFEYLLITREINFLIISHNH